VSQTSGRACFFRSSDFVAAIDGQYSRQVIELESYTPLPRTRADFLGLIYLQGRIIPLLDVYSLFKPDAPAELIPQNLGRAVIMRDGDYEFALATEQVLGFSALPQLIEPTQVSAALARFVLGSAPFNERFEALLLNVPELITALNQRLEVV
jgi:chemotaxis signal transduction protein